MLPITISEALSNITGPSTFIPCKLGLLYETWYAISQLVDNRDSFEAAIDDGALAARH